MKNTKQFDAKRIAADMRVYIKVNYQENLTNFSMKRFFEKNGLKLTFEQEQQVLDAYQNQ